MKSDRLTDTSVQLSERTKEILVQADYSESCKNADPNGMQSAYFCHTFFIILTACTKSRLQMFIKILVLKNFVIFTGKSMCWSLFLIKLQAFRVYIKRLKAWNWLISALLCVSFAKILTDFFDKFAIAIHWHNFAYCLSYTASF